MQINLQYAHHSHHESVTREINSTEEALSIFDNFDWGSEVDKANELQLNSPMLTVLKDDKKQMIWVSAVGNRNDYEFVSSCHFFTERPGFMGFGKKLSLVQLDADSFTKKKARKALELFINDLVDELGELYKQE